MTNSAGPDMALTLDHLPTPMVEVLDNAVIAPMQPDAGLACGVFRADGSFCNYSRTRVAPKRLTDIPEYPATGRKLAGRYLFAGIARHHFGHFMMECTPRLWGLESAGDIDGLIYIDNPNIDFQAALRHRFGGLLNTLSGGLPVVMIDTPTILEHLLVPSPAFGQGAWSVGTPEFCSFVKNRLKNAIEPEGPKKIYISRSALKRAEQRIDQEEAIERMMKAAGYTIFHPQMHKPAVQCQRYMAAEKIVGGDGSAFHLAPFLTQANTRVALIQRRFRRTPIDAIAAQFKACAQIEPVIINSLLPRADDTPSVREAPPPLSLQVLKAALQCNGFL